MTSEQADSNCANNKLFSVLINEIVALAKQYDIKKVVLFGSRARGDNRPTSDIDLAVWGGNVVEFSLDIEEKTSTLLKFDIVNMTNGVSELLKKNIEKEGVEIYAEKG